MMFMPEVADEPVADELDAFLDDHLGTEDKAAYERSLFGDEDYTPRARNKGSGGTVSEKVGDDHSLLGDSVKSASMENGIVA